MGRWQTRRNTRNVSLYLVSTQATITLAKYVLCNYFGCLESDENLQLPEDLNGQICQLQSISTFSTVAASGQLCMCSQSSMIITSWTQTELKELYPSNIDNWLLLLLTKCKKVDSHSCCTPPSLLQAPSSLLN